MRLRMMVPAALACVAMCSGQSRSAADGSPEISISRSGDLWTIAGNKNRAEFNAANLAVSVHAGPAVWNMLPSSASDIAGRRGRR